MFPKISFPKYEVSMKKKILLLMLKYQINILMVFKVFSQYCINISKYQYNIEKKTFNTIKILI